jgi:hypothetical protein
MLRNLDIRGVGPADEMSLVFGERLNLLTGDNGVGKSFVLDVVWWALTFCWAGLPAKPTKQPASIGVEVADIGSHEHAHWRAEYSYPDQAWKHTVLRFHAAAPLGPVVYASVDGFQVFDSHRNLLPPPRVLMGLDPSPRNLFDAYRFSVDEVWNGKDHQGKPVCNGLIRDWVNWMRTLEGSGESGGLGLGAGSDGGEVEPFRLLCKVLEILSDPGEPLIPGPAQPMFVDDTRDFPTLMNPWGGEPIPVTLASAGVRRIIMLAYLLTWVWYEHKRVSKIRQLIPQRQMYVILDEIEMHLHPRWQRRIGPAILCIAKAIDPEMNVQIFATSHSPLVLASLETHVDHDHDRLFNFDTQSGKVLIEELEWVKHGDATGWLTSPAFDTSPYSVEAEQAIRWAESFMAGRLDEIPDEQFRIREGLARRLAEVLADSDPFWVSWYSSREAP